MLYGPKGNGKTSMIHALAKKYAYNLILPDLSILQARSNSYQIQEIITLFKKIKENHEIKPCILFFDNFEIVAGKNSPTTVMKTLLLEIEKINLADDRILMVAATRNLEDIDESLSTIFDDLIKFSNPDELEKSKILRTLIEKVKLENSLDPDEIANDLAFTEDIKNFACADLENLMKNVKLFALKEHRDNVTKNDFELALKKLNERLNLIKKDKDGESPKKIERQEKFQILEDEINNLKNMTSIYKGIIKHGLRLASSENLDFIHRLFNLFKAKNAPFTLEEASKNLGITVDETKKILNKQAFKLIFPKLENVYHVSFDQKMFDEISIEVGLTQKSENDE